MLLHQDAAFGDALPAPDYQQQKTAKPDVRAAECVTAGASADAFVFTVDYNDRSGSCSILTTARGSSITSYSPRSFDIIFDNSISLNPNPSDLVMKGSWYAVV